MSLPAFIAAANTTQQFSPPPRSVTLNTAPSPSTTTTVTTGPHNQFTTFNKPNFIPNVDDPLVSWTASIAHQCQRGRLSTGALMFTRMRLSGIEPNHITFLALLSGCARFPAQALSFGPAIHGYIRKLGLDTEEVKVGSAVMDMYSKFGQMDFARLCFDQMRFRNKVSWNTMVDGYMRNGEIEAAIEIFDEMPVKDAISWTALISGFTRQGLFEEALLWFQEMQLSGVEPDYVTLVSLLSAVSNLGMLGLGLWLHRFMLKKRGYQDNLRLKNSLIDMYCRCGCVDLACEVFESMSQRNLVSWNSIIVGLAINGDAEESIKLFKSMQEEGFKPDGVSFSGALTACSHAGLIKEGLNLFSSMMRVHGISARIEHYGCIVDLYSRAGMLEDAMQVIEAMPMNPNEVILGSLLAACRNCRDVKLAERLMTYLCKLDPIGDSNHVMLSNIYAALGSWQGASHVRKKMKAIGIQKKPGISSIEVDCVIHEFVAGDKSHAETEYIYGILELLSVELGISGYLAQPSFMGSSEFE